MEISFPALLRWDLQRKRIHVLNVSLLEYGPLDIVYLKLCTERKEFSFVKWSEANLLIKTY